MGQLRDQMAHDLELGGYMPKTRRIYLNAIRDFVEHYQRSPTKLGADEVRAWLQRLADKDKLSPQRVRHHMAALRFLYTKTLYKPEVVSFLVWPSGPQKLPIVLAVDEVERLLAALDRPKYRAFFTTVYATGLRLTEARRLETRDIDAARGVIHVREAKGRKERFVMLSPRLLAVLRAYWAIERPPAPWLFASSTSGHCLNPDTARKALRLAAARAGIGKKVTPHVLRHYAGLVIMPSGRKHPGFYGWRSNVTAACARHNQSALRNARSRSLGWNRAPARSFGGPVLASAFSFNARSAER